jgi:hypothetical protein
VDGFSLAPNCKLTIRLPGHPNLVIPPTLSGTRGDGPRPARLAGRPTDPTEAASPVEDGLQAGVESASGIVHGDVWARSGRCPMRASAR